MLLAALLLICWAPVPVSAAGEGPVLKLHYHRPDGDYEGWTVWFWVDQGAAYPFAEENGEMVATFPIPSGASKVGYIVRKGEWTAKDVEADQFVTVSGVLEGTLHLYVESGVPNSDPVAGDDVVRGVVVSKAEYKGDGIVNVWATAQVDDPETAFSIPGAKIEKLQVMGDGSVFRITLAQPLDPLRKYNITLNDKEYPINMPDYFSTEGFEADYTYLGGDLGAVYTPEQTVLRLWAPTARGVTVNLYTDGDPAAQSAPVRQHPMTADVNGTWVCALPGDHNGVYYTYLVDLGDGVVHEACDPYARTTGVNGRRAMILDLASTDPVGWDKDADPNAGKAITDAVIYELHVRDLSADAASGIANAGKFLGLIESGTRSPSGKATGLDHMVELGITHLHLLPSYDYSSVDESRLDVPQFNWGYDPVNYNVPEGSYSTDPYHGEVRVREFKEMVKGLHDSGISVVMDVVYNHVYNADAFCFNQIVPGYFSRPNSNGSGCGNDTASERAMVRRYIVDSVKYWADQYHIDGFRFDLVGLLDVETVNAIVEEVHADHPNVIFYGEGWTMSTNVTKYGTSMATQTNSKQVPGFAFFSDTIRDALKGSVFDQAPGYVSGASGREAAIRQSYMARPGWCQEPTQIINYASCHDNNTLIDRITLSNPNDSREDQVKMSRLAAAIYMTAQGVPFLQAGEELLRSKPLAAGGFDANSYASPDSVNALKWETLDDAQVQENLAYYQGLIAFRKAHPALRLTTAEAVSAVVSPLEGLDKNVTAFYLSGDVAGESALGILSVFNPNHDATTVQLPDGVWEVCVRDATAGTQALDTVSGTVEVSPISALVLVKTAEAPSVQPDATPQPTAAPQPTQSPAAEAPAAPNYAGCIAGGLAVAAAGAAGIGLALRGRRKKED